jgi:signal transduction histidine kinase
MRSLGRALAMLALAALIVGGVATALTLGSDHERDKAEAIVFGLLIGFSWIGTGLYAWWRRPANRFGALMTWVGFTWFLAALAEANPQALFTLGAVLSQLYLAATAHLLLAYPEGRLERPSHRRLVAAGYALALLGPLPVLMFGFDSVRDDCDCPPSVIQVSHSAAPAHVGEGLVAALAVGLVAYLVAIVVRRWRAATAPQRRAMAPVLWSGVALMIVVAGAITSESAGLPGGITGAINVLGLLAFAIVPFAFLLGLLRSRWVRAGAMGDLLMGLGEAPGTGGLRGLLADALGDPSVQLAFWMDERHGWVDRAGHRIRLPAGDDGTRAWTPVELEGRRVGAIVHDATLSEEPALLRSVAAAAGLAVENERLQAQLRARVEELHTSRARLLEAGVAERRRLERNLHDGAQQRLVALSLTLRLAQGKVRKDPDAAEAMLAGAQEELATALAELRELARGIHPAVLSERGLRAALEALAGRSPVPVELAEVPGDRLPEPVEAAAYFVVAEALTNVVKYAHASEATVSVRRRNGTAVVEVRDDGVGGADPGRGSGLRGLADRVAALDGSLELDSPPGAGTRLRAEIPV